MMSWPICLLIACVGGTAKPVSSPGTSSSTLMTGATASTADTSAAVTCDDTFPYDDDDVCVTVNYYYWHEPEACWWDRVERRSREHWGTHSEFGCLPTQPDGATYGEHTPVANHWLADVELCIQSSPLEGECAVSDPNVLPCSEAPFDCCGLPDIFEGPICGPSSAP